MAKDLKSFEEVIKEIANKHNLPFEIVESIIVDWVNVIRCSVKQANIRYLEAEETNAEDEYIE